jgi:polysaccharide pyruvyl transferase WcaK-like protein
MKNLTIEIHGTGTHNRGAELMAIAISENLLQKYPGIKIVVAPGFGSYSIRKKYNFYTTWAYEGAKKTIPWCLTRYMPEFVRKYFLIVNPSSVDVVLDASGFAFSDQWGDERAKRLYLKMNSAIRKNQMLILLPQALGPFSNNEVQKWCKKLFSRADLVIARDAKSFESVNLLMKDCNLRQYPDFTVGLKAKEFDIDLPDNFTAIVPNMRMLDRSNSGKGYIKFLDYIINKLKSLNMNPIFLLHDAEEDEKVISLLSKDNQNCLIVRHDDPMVLKKILGKSKLVIGSRFHALVSAFSQGVPCIGAGWSHKYEELFKDFSSEEFLIKDFDNLNLVDKIINDINSVDKLNLLTNKISLASNKIKFKNTEMWHIVHSHINKVYSA